MSYGMPYQQEQPSQGRRGKPWVLIIGAVLAFIAIILCSIGGFSTFSTVSDLADSPMHSGSHVESLEQGESVAVWSETPGTSCTVTGPSGPVTDASTGTSSVSWGDTQLERVMSIDADQGGDYTISCTAPFVVGDNISGGGLVGMVLGSMLCCFSVVVLGIGLVLWMVRRKA